jgi:hypothetical protein
MSRALSLAQTSTRRHLIRPIENRVDGESWSESAGLNRHIVGDARAPQERRSDSILASSLACGSARNHSEA